MQLDIILNGSVIWIPERVQGSYSTVSLLTFNDRKILVDPSIIQSLRFIEEKFVDMKLNPEEITDILLTHFHLDHAYNSIFFKNADIYVHENYDNKNFSNFGILMGQAYQKMYEETKDRIKKIKDNEILFEKIKVIYTPYHSRDHVSYFVDTDNYGKVFFPGDICMTRIEFFDMQRKLRNDSSSEIMRKYAEMSDYIIFTHDSPFKI